MNTKLPKGNKVLPSSIFPDIPMADEYVSLGMWEIYESGIINVYILDDLQTSESSVYSIENLGQYLFDESYDEYLNRLMNSERSGVTKNPNEQGRCPECDSANISYDGPPTIESSELWYDCLCETCKTEFREVYAIKFKFHERVE